MAGRTYYAWENDGKFFVSFGKPGSIYPVAKFDNREALEAEISRRNANVNWVDGN